MGEEGLLSVLATSAAVKKYQQSEKGKATRRRRENLPENKEKKRLYDNSPEVVARRSARNKTPARREADKLRWATNPKRRAAHKEYTSTPEYKARSKEYEHRPERVLDRRERSKARLGLLRKRKCSCCTIKEIRTYYAAAKLDGFEVDHVVPLALGGLHCINNFQRLTKEQHRLKTNADLAEIARRKREAL